MSIQATCDACGRTYSVPDKYEGKRLACKECGETFEVQGEDDFDFDAPPSRPRKGGSAKRSAAPARRPKKKPGKKRRKSGPNWLAIGLGGGGGLLVLGVLVFVLVTMLGKSHESLAEDLLDATEDLVSVMEGITDEASAKAAVPRIRKIGDRMVAIFKKGQALEESDPLTEEQEDALEAKMKPRMDAIADRQREQISRLQKIPGALQIIQEPMIEMGKKMSEANREARERRRAKRRGSNPPNPFGG